MPAHRRRLPHIYEPGRPHFVTFRLHGSLPENRALPTLTSGAAFVVMDRLLDTARTGPLYLSQPNIAQMLVDTIRYDEAVLKHYDLHAFVVMSNHVHLLITPLIDPAKVMRCLKSFTAKRANKILNRTGSQFWQDESFDVWCVIRTSSQELLATSTKTP